MNLTTISLLALFGIGGFLTAYRHYRDLFSPAGLFCAVWFIPLAVSQLNLSGLQVPFDGLTWLVVLGSGASFLSGCMAVALVKHRVRFSAANLSLKIDLHSGRFRLATELLFWLSIGAYIYEAVEAGGIPLLADERAVAYASFAQNYIHYLTCSTIAVGLLVVGYIRAFGRRKLFLNLCMLFVSSFVLFSLLARLQLFIIIIGALTVLNYTRPRKLSLRALILTLIVFVTLMNVIANLRGGQHYNAFDIGKLNLPDWASALAWPYLYLALNFERLHYVVHAGFPHTNGAVTFLPVLAFTFTRKLFDTSNYVAPLGWYNTATYLWSLYSDFGLYGVFIFPFIYGSFATSVYYQVRTRPSIALILQYSLVIFVVSFLFFENFAAFPPIYAIAFEVWLVMRYAHRKSKAPVPVTSNQKPDLVPGSPDRKPDLVPGSPDRKPELVANSLLRSAGPFSSHMSA